jgi:hypothetical protein
MHYIYKIHKGFMMGHYADMRHTCLQVYEQQVTVQR